MNEDKGEDKKVNREGEQEWKFVECVSNLLTTSSSGIQNIPLVPDLEFVKEEYKIASEEEIEVVAQISLQREFLYDEKLGWHWHKSWNIPVVTANLEVKCKETQERKKEKVIVTAQIFAVQPLKQDTDAVTLDDKGLKGITQKTLMQSSATFASLKFITTSYYHDGKPFHLLITFYIKASGSKWKFIHSVISPPIYVDSRKMARDTDVYKAKKQQSVTSCFPTEMLNASYYKRFSQNNKMIEIQIDNSLDGMCNFLTAPNIRNKVRHPLFLSIKFSKCIKLYYNYDYFLTDNLEEIIGELQSAFDGRMDAGHQDRYNRDPNCIMYMYINCEESKEDCQQTILNNIDIGPQKEKYFKVVFNNEGIGRKYRQIDNVDNLRDAVTTVYGNFMGKSGSESPSITSIGKGSARSSPFPHRSMRISSTSALSAQQISEDKKDSQSSRAQSVSSLPSILPYINKEKEPHPVILFGPQKNESLVPEYPSSNDPVFELLNEYSHLTPYKREVLLQLPLPNFHLATIPVPSLEKIKTQNANYLLPRHPDELARGSSGEYLQGLQCAPFSDDKDQCRMEIGGLIKQNP